MRKIAVDARELQGGMTGIGRFLGNFLETAAAIDDGKKYILLFDRPTPVPVSAANIEQAIIPGKAAWIWDQFRLPRFLRTEGIDLFFSPYYKLPVFSAVPAVITVHDVHFFTLPVFRKQNGFLLNAYYKIAGTIFCRKAASILTVSETSKKDIAEVYGVPGEKIHVAYNGVNHDRFHPLDQTAASREIKRLFPRIRDHYILYVGNSKPHKNLPFLLDAYRSLPPSFRTRHQLLLVGVEESLGVLARNLGLSGEVIMLPNLDENVLPLLYNGAALFVTASLYEGFCLPALEAMASGVPVLVSDRGALPEIVGDAGLLFNPEVPAELTAGIKRIVEDTSLRKDLVIRGLDRARSFSNERFSRKILAVMNNVLGLQQRTDT